jgi:subtilisin family serine protease
MYIRDLNKQKIELDPIELPTVPPPAGARRADHDLLLESSPLAMASRAIFELGGDRKTATRAARSTRRGAGGRGPRPGEVDLLAPTHGKPPQPFRERDTRLLRIVYKEIVLRFAPKVPTTTRTQLITKHGFVVRRTNPYEKDQVVIFDPEGQHVGAELLDIANDLAETDEVIFATPNFVSEYRRHALSIPIPQWHLYNRGKAAGQKKGEDVDAREAWKITRGSRDVVIAIIDDGVDIDHPTLRKQVWRDGKKRPGRDFFLPNDDPDHYNPRPKVFQRPYDNTDLNDIHGTACAGVAAASGTKCYGVAPKCRIMAVKIFHANEMAEDERVADAIRYAAKAASVISLSWSGGKTPDIESAIEDAGRERGGRGVVVFAATGNEDHAPVGFPAAYDSVIGVGASTDQAELASYSNVGKEVSIVAPSNYGILGIFTTDVTEPGRGYNPGDPSRGGKDGLYCNDFGGTSSATPLAAGIGALVLSVNPKLGREDVRGVLESTADKIGAGYDSKGHSNNFGYGRVNAGSAVHEAKARRKRG